MIVPFLMHRYLINSKIEQHQLEEGRDKRSCFLIFECWSVHKSQAFMDWLKEEYPNYHFGRKNWSWIQKLRLERLKTCTVIMRNMNKRKKRKKRKRKRKR